MNIIIDNTMNYVIISDWTHDENKPNLLVLSAAFSVLREWS
jgi:hypothetical protein